MVTVSQVVGGRESGSIRRKCEVDSDFRKACQS